MENDTQRPAYRFVKWIWLLAQCAMPFLAAWYLARFFAPSSLDPAPAVVALRLPLIVSGSVFLIGWLMAEALLCMYRFPLKGGQAVCLVGGFFIQFVVLSWTGESLGYAAFAGIYVTLAALYGCLVALVAFFFKTSIGQDRRRVVAAVIVLALGALPLVFLWPPLWAKFSELSPWLQMVNGLVLLGNILVTLRTLVDFSVWGRPDPQGPSFDAEWTKWAAPTIILLILATVGAVCAAGLYGALHPLP